MKLKYCKDPIVLTSSVGGYCLIDKHCSALPGTICTDDYPGEGGTFKRCECQDDLKPALPDPTLGIIKMAFFFLALALETVLKALASLS